MRLGQLRDHVAGLALNANVALVIDGIEVDDFGLATVTVDGVEHVRLIAGTPTVKPAEPAPVAEAAGEQIVTTAPAADAPEPASVPVPPPEPVAEVAPMPQPSEGPKKPRRRANSGA